MSVKLGAQNIYDFYYLMGTDPEAHGTSPIAQHRVVRDIAITVLDRYGELLKDQIQKYIDRGRVDPDFPKDVVLRGASMEQLARLMHKTFRSDMERRNDRWNLMANYLVQLQEDCKSVDNLPHTKFLLDRVFNLTHNTRELVLDKFADAGDLMQAFETCHNGTLRDIRPYVSHDVIRLLGEAQLRLEGIVAELIGG